MQKEFKRAGGFGDWVQLVGPDLKLHTRACTCACEHMRCGFRISFCYFSVFPSIFNVFILVGGNYSGLSADSDVPLGHGIGWGQPHVFLWARKKCSAHYSSTPRTFLACLITSSSTALM